MQHLILYDGTCGVCQWSIQTLLKLDKKRLFAFAPLEGETARAFQEHIKAIDSMVLVENYFLGETKLYFYSQGVFRICQLLNGIYSLPGLLFYLPKAPFDWFYRQIAKRRLHFWNRSSCKLTSAEDQERFLP